MAGTYNPTDPVQQKFLSAVMAGENASGNPFLGFGGVDLSQAPVDAYGFPQWAGASTSAGPTHAAGLYQFQPGTWDKLAKQYGLNFANPADQHAAAWQLAADTYKAKTGGDLETALSNGDYSGVASVLGSTWTSLTTGHLSSAFNGTATAPSTGNAGQPTTLIGKIAAYLGLTSWETTAVNLFVRAGVFILAFLLIGFGLYFLADQATDGSVGKVAKDAALTA